MTSGLPFWMWFSALGYLLLALAAVHRELTAKFVGLPVFGRVFVAVGLGMFGAEHLAAPHALAQGVPVWMPGRLFWAVFVGFALFAAATSIAVNRYARLAASLTGLMFLLFVAMIHAPNALSDPRNRIFWTVVCREIAFACGLWLFANRYPKVCRVVLGAILVFFAGETFLHPDVIPGVPLARLTPVWIPVRAVWGYVTGLALLAGGVSLVSNRYARACATGLAVVLMLLVVLMYFPILAAAPADMLVEALNYIGDTTLFAGTVLMAAGAMRAEVARDR
jgi:uncharacterized membrane protein